MVATATQRGPVHRLLHEDHDRLAALFDEVVQAAEANVDTVTLGEIWTRFDREMREHLAAEEELLLDPLEARHRGQIRAIRATHDEIRRQLDRMAIDVDLHVVRATGVKALIDLIRDHAQDEDEHLYRMAQAELTEPGLIERLMARLGRSTPGAKGR